MGVRTIPEQFEHECDGCKKTETTEHKDRPKFWGGLIVERHAYDYQGFAVADGTVKRLLCADCLTLAVVKLDEAFTARRALKEKEQQ